MLSNQTKELSELVKTDNGCSETYSNNNLAISELSRTYGFIKKKKSKVADEFMRCLQMKKSPMCELPQIMQQ